MRAALLTVALLCGLARAEFIDGNKLLADMNGSHGHQMSALGYVMGVADTLQGAVTCMPPSVTSGQVMDMVRNYLNNVPRERHMSGDWIVAKVLKDAWPCAARTPGRQL
jgi:hypothetical protein